MLARNIAPDKGGRKIFQGSCYEKHETFHLDLRCAAKDPQVCKCAMSQSLHFKCASGVCRYVYRFGRLESG